jgi:hypothetical protein
VPLSDEQAPILVHFDETYRELSNYDVQLGRLLRDRFKELSEKKAGSGGGSSP